MSAKLALKNLKKSFKDYTIYFLTIAFGVCLFYVFNSLDNQPVTTLLNEDQRDIYKTLINLINGTSVFVSFILAFLILYANRFLIKRRKKELSIYMILGMEKGKISGILVFETFFTGILALAIGLAIGIFASQGLSVVVAHLFEVKSSKFEFSFSMTAVLKTLLYFGIIFFVVMIFNAINISKCKLITLMQSGSKNEQTKIRNLPLSIILFILSVCSLVFAYSRIIKNSFTDLDNDFKLAIAFGIIGTILFFISLSGFLTLIAKHSKKFYYKHLNIFTVRQLTNKVNTNCASMTVTCLMLLITIGVIACAFGVRDGIMSNIDECNPQDASYCNMTAAEIVEDGKNPVIDPKITNEFNVEDLYNDPKLDELADKKVMYNVYQMPFYLEVFKSDKNKNWFKSNSANPEFPITAISLSDYNKIMDLRGHPRIELANDQYAFSCNNSMLLKDFYFKDSMPDIQLNGKTFSYDGGEIIQLQTINNVAKMNMGIIIIGDEEVKKLSYIETDLIVNLKKGEGIDQKFVDLTKIYDDKFNTGYTDYSITSLYVTRQSSVNAMSGLSVLATFISIYIGIIFLISSCAVLALQQLSESSDNAYRYKLLRKIGASSKDLNSALFRQIGAYFLLPLVLAVIHAFVGVKAAIPMIQMLGDMNITQMALITGAIIVAVYALYFLATYFTSKNIINKEK